MNPLRPASPHPNNRAPIPRRTKSQCEAEAAAAAGLGRRRHRAADSGARRVHTRRRREARALALQAPSLRARISARWAQPACPNGRNGPNSRSKTLNSLRAGPNGVAQRAAARGRIGHLLLLNRKRPGPGVRAPALLLVPVQPPATLQPPAPPRPPRTSRREPLCRAATALAGARRPLARPMQARRGQRGTAPGLMTAAMTQAGSTLLHAARSGPHAVRPAPPREKASTITPKKHYDRPAA